MFKTCMFCHRPLGSNEVIEHFPVGRRLAYDAERGRLWVVCRRCDRWNLSPLEERWEAVEMCERLFRDTRIRVSTENVGLARHPEGLELVRIGQPMRPEFAAWRYGDQFGRRRKRALLFTAGALAVVGGITVAGAAVGSSPFWAFYFGRALMRGRSRVKLHTDDGRMIQLNSYDLVDTRMAPADDTEGFRVQVRKRRKKKEWFEGAEAERFASQIITKMNRMGGDRRTVQEAVVEIELHGHPDEFIRRLVAGEHSVAEWWSRRGAPGQINSLPAPTRLALEMALHEEQERLALEGELWRLERAWEEAEEIAAISDSLLLPEETGEFLEKHREVDEGGQD